MIASIRRTMVALRIVLAACLGWAIPCAGASAGSPTLVAQPGVTAPASIPELARALKYDANLIYEYVYTNIEYSPTYGLKKGALGTLLDGVGNDFDQSALLVALLRESGYTASYANGFIRLTAAEAAALYGVVVDNACPLYRLLSSGGIPMLPPTNCVDPFPYVDIPHVWVLATGGSLGATTYALDPSYKLYDSASGLGNLATIMGYNQATFLNSAKSGATIVPGLSIQNLNKASIASALQGYAHSLVGYIRANAPTSTTRTVIGGNYIRPLTQPYSLPTSLSYKTPGTTPDVWTGEVPNEYRTILRVQIGSIDKTWFADEIYGHRLSVVYDANARPTLYLDGAAQGQGAPGVATISYTVDFPFCVPSGPSCLFTSQNAVKAQSGYTYAIIAGWDFSGRGMVELHRRQLQANRAAGGADGSEAVLGEALNMVGYAWLAQFSAANAVTDRLAQSKVVTQCAIGVAAWVGGPYVDLPGVLIGTSSRTNDLNRRETAYFADAGAGSALEWGTLEQNLAGSGVGAVSTVKLIDIANSQGDVIYDATQANWTSVRGQLVAYSDPDLATLDNYIDNLNYRVVLPRHGNLTEGSWTGAGFIGISPTSGTDLRYITYAISSNLKGGYTTEDLPAEETVEDVSVYSPPIYSPPQFYSYDPIDLSSGAFHYDREDLSLGSADFPIGLAFRRSYNSNNLYDKGPLGPGWSHNLSITALVNSDGLKGLGQDSPIDGAAAIAAIHVAQDLFSDAAKPFDKVLVATLVQRWMMDRLIGNTVNVTAGSQAEQFVKLADGTYNPRPGSSSRLSFDGSAYTLKYKDATTLGFDANGNLSTWVVPSGVTATFSYDGSTPPLPIAVSNGLGRTLTLAYNGQKQLVAASDNTGRSVSYAYDGHGNLASLVDVLGFTTTFAYTSAGGPAPTGLLSEIFYPARPGNAFVSNRYDTLGRVAAQTNASGATWSYFFAGYRSEEVDAHGTRRVLYYNTRGKAHFDIQDQAGLNLVTRMSYDGLDRLSTLTLPEGDATSWLYDNTVNPWANNIVNATRIAKGATATATTNYVIDPTFNKPLEITRPRPSNTPPLPPRQVTTVTYDPANGNVASIVPDSGGIAPRTRYTYTGVGQVASITDPMGTVTTFTYDGAGNRLSMVEDAGPGRLGRTTLYGYDERGDVVSLTDPNGNVTRSQYDAGRRLVVTTSPATSAAPAGIVTTNSYDPEGRLLQVQQSSGGTILRTTSATWTPTGKPATATDANGNVTRYEYDRLDRQIGLTDAMGRVTRFTYDAVSRPLQTLNPAIRKPASPTEPAPLLTQAWTPDGKLASLTDANGNTTTFAYDGFNRLATTTYPDPVTGLAGTTETYTYDNVDNVLTRKTRAGATITFGYDTLYRLTSKTPPSAPVVIYAYDRASRPTRISDTSAPIAAAVPPGGSTVTYGTTYTYDALNRPTRVSWDPAPAVTPPAAGTLVTFGHSYDRTNRRIGQTVSDNTWLAYPAGAPSTTSYTADKLNRYSAVTGLSPSYDANGNLTGDGTYTYGYDAENRMVSAAGAANISTYAYDGRGWRKNRTVNGTTTISVTDNDNREVLEYDGSTGGILRWYAYGLGPNDVLNQMNVPAAIRSAYVPDIQGSIVGTFNSAGTLTRSTYLGYGSSSAAASPFGYTGQRSDVEAGGLYYYRARYYSPLLGRFLQIDPAGYGTGTNLYAYVENDPLNRVDPTGLISLEQYITRSIRVVNALITGSHPVTGIPFKGGFPDFSSVATRTVDLARVTGNPKIDRAAANAMAGLESTPAGYVWHHAESGVAGVSSTRMQLVPETIHAATGHTGPAAYARAVGGLVRDIVTDPTTYMWTGVGTFIGAMMPSPANANESELLQAQRLREANQAPISSFVPQFTDQSTNFLFRPK